MRNTSSCLRNVIFAKSSAKFMDANCNRTKFIESVISLHLAKLCSVAEDYTTLRIS